jgi:hypothetical protein
MILILFKKKVFSNLNDVFLMIFIKDPYHSASFLSTTPRTVLYSLMRKRIILLNLRFSSSSAASLVRVETHINVRVI